MSDTDLQFFEIASALAADRPFRRRIRRQQVLPTARRLGGAGLFVLGASLACILSGPALARALDGLLVLSGG